MNNEISKYFSQIFEVLTNYGSVLMSITESIHSIVVCMEKFLDKCSDENCDSFAVWKNEKENACLCDRHFFQKKTSKKNNFEEEGWKILKNYEDVRNINDIFEKIQKARNQLN